jgi:acyl carrier protein
MDIENKVKKVFSDVLEISIEEINEHTSPNNNSNWDSFNTIKLVIMLEAEFDINISIEEVININNFSKMLILVKEKLS